MLHAVPPKRKARPVFRARPLPRAGDERSRSKLLQARIGTQKSSRRICRSESSETSADEDQRLLERLVRLVHGRRIGSATMGAPMSRSSTAALPARPTRPAGCWRSSGRCSRSRRSGISGRHTRTRACISYPAALLATRLLMLSGRGCNPGGPRRRPRRDAGEQTDPGSGTCRSFSPNRGNLHHTIRNAPRDFSCGCTLGLERMLVSINHPIKWSELSGLGASSDDANCWRASQASRIAAQTSD